MEPEDPRSYYSVSSRLVNEVPNSWKPNQYDNPSNAQAHYESTGPEIWEQTGGKVDHLVVGVGTGGTICGTGKYLKEKNPNLKVWGIDTYGSVFKKYKETGIFDKNEIYPYITEGIGEDFLPKNVDFSIIDHFEKVTDKDAAIYTREISRKEGIFVGNSAGSAIAGVIQLKDQFKEGETVVVIFHDHGTRYLGKMFNDDWMRDRGFLNKENPKAIDLVDSHKNEKLITVDANQTVAETIYKLTRFNISQIPVVKDGKFIGSVNDSHILGIIAQNPDVKTLKVQDIMQAPFPFVNKDASMDEISKLIDKNNNAVMIKIDEDNTQIITQHDIISALAR